MDRPSHSSARTSCKSTVRPRRPRVAWTKDAVPMCLCTCLGALPHGATLKILLQLQCCWDEVKNALSIPQNQPLYLSVALVLSLQRERAETGETAHLGRFIPRCRLHRQELTCKSSKAALMGSLSQGSRQPVTYPPGIESAKTERKHRTQHQQSVWPSTMDWW